MGQVRKINTRELEKQIAEKKSEEKRKSRDHLFQIVIVVISMFGIYAIFQALRGDSSQNTNTKDVNNTEQTEPSTKKAHKTNSK
jgi:hypothetical protein